MRLIDADALKKAIQADIDMGDNACDTGYLNAMDMCLELIDNAPTVNKCDNCDLMLIAKMHDMSGELPYEQ